MPINQHLPNGYYSITAESSREWLREHELELKEYLLKYHSGPYQSSDKDWSIVTDLIYWQFPDEGKKLIENYNLSEEEKKDLFMEFIYYSPQITCLIFADERMGKDVTICKFFDEVKVWCIKNNLPFPRFVTLGNVKIPPMVNPKDRFFSFRHLPSGKGSEQIWVYSSELESLLPARVSDGGGDENKTFSLIAGTFAQNHVKLFGCVKLASKVDINAIRGCNAKIFKYINPEKLQINNVERANILSPLGGWLLPKDRNNKSETLLAFDNQLFSVNYDLPEWWTQEYSEQFNEVSEADIWDFIDSVCLNEKPSAILDIIANKFRNKTITLKQISDHLKQFDIK